MKNPNWARRIFADGATDSKVRQPNVSEPAMILAHFQQKMSTNMRRLICHPGVSSTDMLIEPQFGHFRN